MIRTGRMLISVVLVLRGGSLGVELEIEEI